jgi:hypothetical protein
MGTTVGGPAIFRLKVTLRGSRPPIWRRVEVPAGVTLFQFHRILQIAMGWMDSHLHQFRRGNSLYGEPDPEYGVHRHNEKKVQLQDVLSEPRDRMIYEYDFGDSWEHEVLLVAITAPSPGAHYPQVLAGKGACPPEDVGGIWGYYEFLATIRDPKRPDHEDMLEWCGGGFDPDAFDIDETNRVLRSRIRRKPGL